MWGLYAQIKELEQEVATLKERLKEALDHNQRLNTLVEELEREQWNWQISARNEF